MNRWGSAVRSTAARLLAGLVAGVVLAPILLLAGASPVYAGRCNTGVHEPSLDGLTATPSTGTPSTTIQFAVVYRDTRGCEPSSVTIVIPGVGSIAMTRAGGTFKGGMTYTASTTLPAGTWTYGAGATSGFGPGVKTVFLSGSGSIVIASPTPTPTPTPKPTPTPTPKPTPTPTPTPTPRPTATPAPTAQPTRTPSPSPKPGSTGPKTSPKPAKSPTPKPGAGSSAPPPSPAPSESGSGVPGGAIGGAGGPDGSPRDGSTRTDGGPSGIVPILLAAVVVTFGGGLLVVARRRRHRPEAAPADVPEDVPEEPVLQPTPIELGPLAPIDAALQGHLPMRPALRFAKPAKAGTVRGTIAYRHVRVSAGPDDLRFAELARLEQRDEVEVIGEAGGYLQVRMPDGLTGWVPRMVLVTASGLGTAGA